MKIVLDFDNTIADTPQAMVDLYNEITGENVVLPKMYDWGLNGLMDKWTLEDRKNIFINPRFFKLLKLYDGAVETIQKLKDDGDEIAICTVHNPKGIWYKAEYINEYLTMVDQTYYIVNGCNMNKAFITGDLIVDDHINNLVSAQCRYKLCYGSWGWNQEWAGNRALDWDDVYKKINIIKKEMQLSETFKSSKRGVVVSA